MRSCIFSSCLTMLIFGLFTSCGQSRGTSESTFLGLTNTEKLVWADSDVSVCFDEAASTSPNFDALMVGSIEAMNLAFRPESTGVSFSGQKKCAEDSNVDAVIIFKTVLITGQEGLMGVSASIGTAFLADDSPELSATFAGRYGVQVKSTEGFTENLKWTLLHELGHLVGMWHEHAHIESTCNITGESAATKEGVPFEIAADAYQGWGTAYDNKSIMNYCVGDALRDGYSKDSLNSFVPTAASLSECDAAVLKHVYSGAEIPSACTTDSSVKKPSANPGFPQNPIDPNGGIPVDPNIGFPIDPFQSPVFPNPVFPNPVYPDPVFPNPTGPLGTPPGVGSYLPSCMDIDYLSQNTGVCINAANQCHIFNYGYPEAGVVSCSILF